MYTDHTEYLTRFHEVLVECIEPEIVGAPAAHLTVADIYYELVPYLTCREKLGLDSVMEYERLFLRLLAGEGGYMEVESLADRQKLQREVDTRFPDPGLLRDYLSAGVKILPSNRDRPEMDETPAVKATVKEEPTPQVAEKTPDLPPFERCPSCVEALPRQARVHFCPSCGEDVRRTVCISCKELLPLNWRFCIACGTEVEPEEEGLGPH
jgi:predicted RNA-binding Zn-ribbon protein involved in translation (DUF1610 family)